MAEIVPFQGVYYDNRKVGGLERVIGPPYDVISPEEQEALYEASPYNFVRVMLNRAEPGDDAVNNSYTRTAGFLRDWREQGVLREDDAPALYVYRQTFNDPVDGARRTRTGLFCALKLEPYSAGVVLPHEETRPKAKEDRLRLMRATRSNPEPIYALYEDADGFVASALSGGEDSGFALDATVDGDTHSVRRVSDASVTAAVQEFLRERRIWIADGHHRYETALAYRDERRAAEGGADGARAYDYLLVVLSAFTDPGIVVLPTHRLVRNVPEGRIEQLDLLLERYFTVEPVFLENLAARMAADPAAGVHRFGVVTPRGAKVITLRDEAVMDAAVEGHSAVWKRLDVSILQTLVLDRSLGIPVEALSTTPDVAYTRDRDEAVQRVRSGEFQLAFLLNLPAADEVRQVAAAGDKMPAKSTFFYPKLWSGLLMRSLE